MLLGLFLYNLMQRILFPYNLESKITKKFHGLRLFSLTGYEFLFKEFI